MALFPSTSIASAAGGYDIDNSCRFNDDDSPYMNRTPSGAGNRKTWSFSCWYKLGNPTSKVIFGSRGDSTNQLYIALESNHQLAFRNWISGNTTGKLQTNRLFRDPSAWYHFLFVYNSTDSTATQRMRIYVNGTEETSFESRDNPTENLDGYANQAIEHRIGEEITGGVHLDGYLAEVHFVDGTACTPSDFGEAGDYGEWKAKEYSGSHGTNGFYLDFSGTPSYTTGDRSSSITPTTSLSMHAGTGAIGDLIDGGYNVDSPDATVFTNSQTVNSSSYIRFQWSSGQIYTAIKWYQEGTTNQGTWKIQGSNNGSAWTDLTGNITLGGGTALYGPNRYTTDFLFSNTTSYTYYQFVGVSGSTTNASWIAEVEFGTGGNLGTDASGNGKNFALNNIAASDQVADSPTNNFSVISNIDGNIDGNDTFTEGNLKFKNTANGNASHRRASFAMASGKWYWEVLREDSPGEGGATLGISPIPAGNPTSHYIGTVNTFIVNGCGIYGNGGTLAGNNTINGTSQTQALNDVIQWAYDADTGKLWLGFNGTWRNSGNPATGANPWANITSYATVDYSPAFQSHNNVSYVANFGQDGTFAGNITAGGNSDDNEYGNFKHDVPAGFLALCSKNLPEPVVKPKEHFNVKLYDDGAGAKTGVGFAPELIWLKARGSAYNHKMCDVIQGTGKALQPNVGDAQITEATGLTAFGTDGFTVGSDTDYSDTTGDGMVAWCWKLGGTASANTNGSITSSVSANVTAGVSVGTWTGSGANATIGHGLSKAPDVIVVHAYNSPDSWPYGMIAPYASIDFTDYLRRDSYTGVADADTIWNDTAPTTSVFSVGSGAATNASGATWRFEAYHAVEGFSAFGSYLGDNDVDGSFCYTGFRPKWIMIKGTSGTTGWAIADTARESYNPSWKETPIANNTHVEDQSGSFYKDFLSNGFKIRCSSCSFFNYSGRHYVWAAFAEYPFKYTNAH